MAQGEALALTPSIPTLLLVNPESRHGRAQFSRYRDLLQDALNLVDAALTTSRRDMEARIKQGLSNDVRRIVVGGGDGTLSCAADCLAGTDGMLGVLPLGTGNTFAHGLTLPASPSELVKLLAQGPVARYDVGLAVKDSESTKFLNSVTMGFSERLVALLTRESKDRLGYVAWIAEFRQALANTPPLSITLRWPGGGDTFETRQLVVVNGRTVAAAISPTPASSGQDGLLEVFRLGDPSLLSILRTGTKLLTGRLLTDKDARYRTVDEVTVDAAPRMPVTIDGDTWLTPPLTCRVLPSALWIIAPQAFGQARRQWPPAFAAREPDLFIPFKRSYTMRSASKKHPPLNDR